MAWIRTALSMISFGFTIGKLGQVMNSVEVKGHFGLRPDDERRKHCLLSRDPRDRGAPRGRSAASSPRAASSTHMGLAAEFSISFIVSLLLVVVGGFALSSLVMAL